MVRSARAPAARAPTAAAQTCRADKVQSDRRQAVGTKSSCPGHSTHQKIHQPHWGSASTEIPSQGNICRGLLCLWLPNRERGAPAATRSGSLAAHPRHHWLGPALGISLVVLAAHGPAMKGRAADQASVWVDVWAGQQDFSRQHEPQRANTTERGSPTVRLSLGRPL